MRVIAMLLLAMGFVLAQEVEVHAVVTGKVSKLYVKEGMAVKKGQLLLEIDPALYKAEEKNLMGKKEEIEARLWKVERDYRRLQELFDRDLLAETTLEDQKIRYDTLVAQIKQVEGQIERVRVLISYTKVYSPVNGRIKRLYVGEGSYVNGSLQPHVLMVIER